MVDYSRWDNIDVEDSDSDESQVITQRRTQLLDERDLYSWDPHTAATAATVRHKVQQSEMAPRDRMLRRLTKLRRENKNKPASQTVEQQETLRECSERAERIAAQLIAEEEEEKIATSQTGAKMTKKKSRHVQSVVQLATESGAQVSSDDQSDKSEAAAGAPAEVVDSSKMYDSETWQVCRAARGEENQRPFNVVEHPWNAVEKPKQRSKSAKSGSEFDLAEWKTRECHLQERSYLFTSCDQQ
jgi:hypothetical protein